MKLKSLIVNGTLGGAGAALGWYLAEGIVLPAIKPANHTPMFAGALFGATPSTGTENAGSSMLSGLDAWDLLTLSFMGAGALLGIRVGHSVGL